MATPSKNEAGAVSGAGTIQQSKTTLSSNAASHTANRILSMQQRKGRRNINNSTNNTRTMNDQSGSMSMVKQQ